jgi:iron complex transport system permease protein
MSSRLDTPPDEGTGAVDVRPDDIARRAEGSGLLSGGLSRSAGLVLCLAVVLVLVVLSIAVGAKQIPLHTVADALLHHDPTDQDHLIITSLRIPRTVLGILAGMALGVGGAVMQGLSRNPLADPGILGVNAGAAMFVVFSIAFFGFTTLNGYIWFAFLGAALASVAVYAIGSLGREGATPVKLSLAGAALTTFMASITGAILLTDIQLQQHLRYWGVGSLSGRELGLVLQMVPFMVAGLVVAVLCAPALNALALGDDMARGLGMRVGWARASAAVAVVLLCGAATAAAGPIAFVGLVVPHVARLITGPDYRWIIPYTMLLSPALMLGADIVGRVVVRPGELQAGIVTVAVGAPFFIWLVRRRNLAEL